MRRSQQEEERFCLDRFLEGLETPAERIERGADPPDFVLSIAGRRVAVEVTGFHSAATGDGGHARRAVEEEWDALRETISNARPEHPELDSLDCQLMFKGLLVPRRRDHVRFAEELIVLVQGLAGQVTKARTVFRNLEGFALLGKYLRGVVLSRPGCYMTWDWDKNAAFVGMNEAELSRTVSPKLQRPRPRDVDENWLLVVSGHRLSQSMGVPHIEQFRAYVCLNKALANGPYDAVYVFEYMLSRILRWRHGDDWTEVKRAQWARGTQE